MKKKAIIALVVAALMAIQVPMVAMAEEVDAEWAITSASEDTHDAIVTTKRVGVDAYEAVKDRIFTVNGSVTVNTNITTNDTYGVCISTKCSPENDKFIVNGDVNVAANNTSSEQDAGGVCLSENNDEITINGDVNVTNKQLGDTFGVGFGDGITTNSLIKAGNVTVKTENTGNDEDTYGIIATMGSVEVKNVSATTTGTGSAYGIIAMDGGKATAESVSSTANMGTAISASGASSDGKNPTTVTVTGAVTNNGEGRAIEAGKGAKVTAGSVTNNSGNSTTVYSGKDAEVHITGDAVNKGNVKTASVIKAENGTVTVDGNVKQEQSGSGSSAAIIVQAGGTVKVEKNVDAVIRGIDINNTDASKKAEVSVFGTITATDAIVKIADSSKDNFDLNVYEIKAAKLAVDGAGADISESVQDKIHYIIKNASTAGSFTITAGTSGKIGEVTDAQGVKYQTATAANDYKVTVATIDGYTFKQFAGTSASLLTDNGDGTYTLVMPNGGGVSLDLVYEAIKKQEEQKQSKEIEVWTVVPSSKGSAEAPVSNGAWSSTSGAFKYTVNGDTVKNAIATIQYKAADGNTYTGKFFFDKTGAMQTGWHLIDGVWYYFSAAQGPTQGMMLTNTTTPDGYQVGANGAWIH